MHNKNILHLFILLFTVSSHGAVREKDLLSLINIEINTISKVAKKGEQLNYRLFELYIEKTKILRRTENELLLKDQASGKKVVREKYFINSENNFKSTQAFGLKKLIEFPKSRYLPAFYYGLASHQIEIQNNIERDQKQILYWLHMALSKATNDEKRYTAQVKLAEVYYAVKDYDKSIKYYNIIIKNKEDRWYTKNLYNLSWCYFQTKDYGRSVALATKAFHASADRRYENVAEVSMDALDYFYVFFKKPELGVQFHIRYNKNPLNRMEHFLKLINLSKKFISSDVALQTEKPTRKFCKEINDNLCLLNLSGIKLDIYRENKDYVQHYALIKEALVEYKSVKLLKLDFDQSVVNAMINNIGETASTYQQLVYKSYYTFRGDAEETYKTIVDYYQILKEFNPTFQYEYAFLQGELSFKENKYDLAGKFYFESLSKVHKEVTAEFIDKIFKSMLALANEPKFQDKEYFEKSHLAYINHYDKKPNVVPIYEALFKFYQSEKKWSSSEGLLVRFAANMPQEAPIQKEMTKVVLNNFAQIKDIARMNFWIVKLRGGFLSFDKLFIDANVKILAQLLFERAQEKEKKHEYASAIAEYEKIVQNKEYPDEVRADSMYNISINYLNLKNAAQSYSWLKDSIRLKTQEEIAKKVTDIEAIAHDYVIIQALPEASSLYKYLLKNQCSLLKDVDSSFLVYSQLEITQKRVGIFDNIAMVGPCTFKKDTYSVVRSLYIDWLWQEKLYLKIGNLAKNSDYKEHWDEIFHSFYLTYWRFNNYDNNPEFALFNEQMKKFFEITRSALSEASIMKFSAIESWKQEDESILSYQQKIKRKGTQQGSLKFLQPQLETELQELMDLKESKLKIVDSLKDPNLYQAQFYSLISRFQTAKDWLITWQCKTANPNEKAQWAEVQKQVVQGLDEQVTSFKDVVSNVLSKGAIPLSGLQKVRGDASFDKYFYEDKKDATHFIMYRATASSGEAP